MIRKSALFLALLTSIFLWTTSLRAQENTSTGNDIQVTEARLGTSVENRMIVGEDSSFALNSKVFFWMRITGASGAQITVTWKNGDLSHTAELTIGGSPWRTWATKTVSMAGDWTVSVSDASGNVLKEMMFKVQ